MELFNWCKMFLPHSNDKCVINLLRKSKTLLSWASQLENSHIIVRNERTVNELWKLCYLNFKHVKRKLQCDYVTNLIIKNKLAFFGRGGTHFSIILFIRFVSANKKLNRKNEILRCWTPASLRLCVYIKHNLLQLV